MNTSQQKGQSRGRASESALESGLSAGLTRRHLWVAVILLLGLLASLSCSLTPRTQPMSESELATAVALSLNATSTTEARIMTQVAGTVAASRPEPPPDQPDPVRPEVDPALTSAPPAVVPEYVPPSAEVITPEPVEPEATTPAPEPETPEPETPESETPDPPPSSDLIGRIAFVRNPYGNDGRGHDIVVLDIATGTFSQLTSNDVPDWNPDWSPDGGWLCFTSLRSGNYDVWVMRADGSQPASRIALDAWDDYPVWSPDGGRFAFISTGVTGDVANSELFIGSSTENTRRLTANTGRDEWPAWSPDGGWIAVGSDRDGDYDIYLIPVDGGDEVQWTQDPAYDEQPAWSPDGQWIAFLRKAQDTNGNGRLDRRDDGDFGNVWIGRRDGTEFRQLTFDNAAADPAWSPDGTRIVFAHFADTNGDGRVDLGDAGDLWAIPIAGGDVIVLTEGPENDWAPAWTW